MRQFRRRQLRACLFWVRLFLWGCMPTASERLVCMTVIICTGVLKLSLLPLQMPMSIHTICLTAMIKPLCPPPGHEVRVGGGFPLLCTIFQPARQATQAAPKIGARRRRLSLSSCSPVSAPCSTKPHARPPNHTVRQTNVLWAGPRLIHELIIHKSIHLIH